MKYFLSVFLLYLATKAMPYIVHHMEEAERNEVIMTIEFTVNNLDDLKK